jgi:flagellar protein FliJ
VNFQFKLEALLKYRCLLEEQAQQALFRQQLVLDDLQQLLAGQRAERLKFVEELENRKKENLPALLFSFYMELLDFKEREIRGKQQMLAVQSARVEKARQFLLGRIRERKVIEKIRENDYRRFQQEWSRREEKDNDELTVLRHGRNGDRSK